MTFARTIITVIPNFLEALAKHVTAVTTLISPDQEIAILKRDTVYSVCLIPKENTAKNAKKATTVTPLISNVEVFR